MEDAAHVTPSRTKKVLVLIPLWNFLFELLCGSCKRRLTGRKTNDFTWWKNCRALKAPYNYWYNHFWISRDRMHQNLEPVGRRPLMLQLRREAALASARWPNLYNRKKECKRKAQEKTQAFWAASCKKQEENSLKNIIQAHLQGTVLLFFLNRRKEITGIIAFAAA